MATTGSPAGRTLIVGAGPAGLALARQLARRRLPVTLIESRASIGGGFRGEALMPSGFEALGHLELLPLSDAVPQHSLRGWSFWLERQPLFTVPEPMGSAHPCTLVDHEALLQDWAQQLQQLPSAQLLLGRSVAGLITADNSAGEERISGVRLSDGERLPAELVVACDGRGSLLRRSAGLELSETSPTIDVLWFRLVGPAGDALANALAGRFHTVIGDEGSLALFAAASGGVQLGWPLQGGERIDRSTRQWRELWLQLCPQELATVLATVPVDAIDGPLRLPLRVGLARRWWRPGLLLLGDAAHPMSPIRAQGTSMALRDVVAAAALLPPTLELPTGSERDAALDQALVAIEALRRPEIARMQAMQQQEWERGLRLGHNPALRRLLAALAPGLAPILGAVWRRSQWPLRQGLAGGLRQAAMMEPVSAAR